LICIISWEVATPPLNRLVLIYKPQGSIKRKPAGLSKNYWRMKLIN